MTLKEFKEHIEKFSSNKEFKFGISEPFSWRGSYDEVAFEFTEFPMSREDILKNIKMAYDNTFYGYKGGEYTYSDHTEVNFERNDRTYTCGEYTEKWIEEIESREKYESDEEKLIRLAFK